MLFAYVFLNVCSSNGSITDQHLGNVVKSVTLEQLNFHPEFLKNQKQPKGSHMTRVVAWNDSIVF